MKYSKYKNGFRGNPFRKKFFNVNRRIN